MVEMTHEKALAIDKSCILCQYGEPKFFDRPCQSYLHRTAYGHVACPTSFDWLMSVRDAYEQAKRVKEERDGKG